MIRDLIALYLGGLLATICSALQTHYLTEMVATERREASPFVWWVYLVVVIFWPLIMPAGIFYCIKKVRHAPR